MEIYFMRHGRSMADDEEKHEGRYDSPLTSLGKEQALKRAELFKEEGLKFDKIISSPLVRALETAQIIEKVLGSKVETNSDLMEMDNGAMAGLTFKEALIKFPIPKFQNPYNRMANGTGESPWQLQARAIYALEKILQREEGKYLVVAHGGILNAILRTIVGAQPPVNNGGLYFDFGDTGFIKTVYVKDKNLWVIRKFEPGFFVP